MNVAISPMPGVELVEWSVLETVRSSTTWNNRPVYFFLYTHGAVENYFKEFPFSLTFEVPESFTSDYYFDISLGANFFDDERTKSKGFIDFTNAFPKWANVQNWTSYYASYQYR